MGDKIKLLNDASYKNTNLRHYFSVNSLSNVYENKYIINIVVE